MTRPEQNAEYVRHNHWGQTIKPKGECPACDYESRVNERLAEAYEAQRDGTATLFDWSDRIGSDG